MDKEQQEQQEEEDKPESKKLAETPCVICGGLTMPGEKVCPACRQAALSSKSGSEYDDTEDLELAELQHTRKIFITEAGIPLVYVPAGEFVMGSDNHQANEKPQHALYLDDYYIGRFPITNWQYQEFMKDSGQPAPPHISEPGYGEPDQPVVGVSWHDARDFCRWLSRKTKKHFSPPTEAQWEKAARGPDGNKYPWGKGNPTREKAHYSGKLSSGPPAEVTAHPAGASEYGCQDMVGNIWEWTADAYSDTFYSESKYDNPKNTQGDSKFVLRGGGRSGRGDFLRSTRRVGGEPDAATNQTGFRVARSIEKEEFSSDLDNARRKHEARAIVGQAKTATDQGRRHNAKILLQKALALNPDNGAAKRLLGQMPKLPEGLEPAKKTPFHQKTGLPLEAFCELTGSSMVLVPAGEFLMGSDKGRADERPEHAVFLESFYIDKFEVTNEMFTQFLDLLAIPDNKEARKLFEPNNLGILRQRGTWAAAPGVKKHPAVCITWFGAQQFAQWAGMDLPSEAQWEKAARGTDNRFFPWGDDFSPDMCNCKQSGIMKTTPVNQYPGSLSPCGCWDMAGNVWEWCCDWYAPDYYQSTPKREPLGPETGEKKVLKGGGWGADPSALRCCARFYAPPAIHIDTLGGFRCVKLLKPRKKREEGTALSAITKLLKKPILGTKKSTRKQPEKK